MGDQQLNFLVGRYFILEGVVLMLSTRLERKPNLCTRKEALWDALSLWGLASGAEAGVRYVLEMMRQEFDLAMALSGCPTLSSITRDLIRAL